MLKVIAQRLIMLPVPAIAANAAGFLYAWLAQRTYNANNPLGAPVEASSALGAYAHYVVAAIQLDFGSLPRAGVTVAQVVLQAAGHSALLLLAAFVLSIVSGTMLGQLAAHTFPARTARWLAGLAAIGNATPSFYLGIVGVTAILAFGGDGSLLPTQGAGTFAHLILPTLALVVRPSTQLARFIAHLLVMELHQPYIATARAYGYSFSQIRQRHALPNISAPTIAFVAGLTRWLIGELIIVEWLFNWPGLGRLLAQTLMQPVTTAQTSGVSFFLHPELLALSFSVIAALFMLIDLFRTVLTQRFDPRLRS